MMRKWNIVSKLPSNPHPLPGVGKWQKGHVHPPIGPQCSVEGNRVRDAIRDWCNSEAGWVPFQYRMAFPDEPSAPQSDLDSSSGSYTSGSDSSCSDMDTSDEATATTPPGPSGDAAPMDMVESDDSDSTIIYKL